MGKPEPPLSTSLAPLTPLTYSWLALVALTLFSLDIGQWFHGMVWLPLLVAAIVWIKGIVIARYFIESHLTHPFIRRVLPTSSPSPRWRWCWWCFLAVNLPAGHCCWRALVFA